jgi:hypothetical protein
MIMALEHINIYKLRCVLFVIMLPENMVPSGQGFHDLRQCAIGAGQTWLSFFGSGNGHSFRYEVGLGEDDSAGIHLDGDLYVLQGNEFIYVSNSIILPNREERLGHSRGLRRGAMISELIGSDGEMRFRHAENDYVVRLVPTVTLSLSSLLDDLVRLDVV